MNLIRCHYLDGVADIKKVVCSFPYRTSRLFTLHALDVQREAISTIYYTDVSIIAPHILFMVIIIRINIRNWAILVHKDRKKKCYVSIVILLSFPFSFTSLLWRSRPGETSECQKFCCSMSYVVYVVHRLFAQYIRGFSTSNHTRCLFAFLPTSVSFRFFSTGFFSFALFWLYIAGNGNLNIGPDLSHAYHVSF